MNEKSSILNILIVSLDEQFAKAVSSALASKLDMFEASCKDLIEYDLINPKDVLDKCGLEYLKKRESKVVFNCSSYSNTIITIGFEYFKDYFMFFDKSLILYLDLPDEKLVQPLNKIDYVDRTSFIKDKVDIIIELDDKNEDYTVNKIIKKLGENL